MTRPAVEPKVELVGVRELRAAMRRAGRDLSDLKTAGQEAATIVATAAKSFAAPTRLTGAMEASIRPAGQAAGAVVRAGSAALPYVGPIHFGWPARHIEPNPFLYDALDERREEVVEKYEEHVRQIIKTI